MTRSYPQFDALRALAVGCVLYHHWLWPAFVASDAWYFAPFKVSLGGLGVTIFFVLSGFLITEILVKGQRLEPAEKRQFIRAFYIRRSLRIFPIYFLVIAAVALLAGGLYRENLWWFAAYAANVRMFVTQDDLVLATHLWTLAVEEQFYLVAPLVVVFFAASFRAFAIAVIAVAAVVKIGAAVFYPETQFVHMLPIISMQALAVGGLLSFRDETAKLIESMGLPLAVWWLVPALLLQMAGATDHAGIITTLSDYGALGLSIWLVTRAREGFAGVVGKVLAWRWLAHLGVISYGIYLFHNFAPMLLHKALPGFNGLGVVTQFGLLALSTLVLAQLSWVLIEGPINRFKRHFPYRVAAERDGIEKGGQHRAML